jgi:hypothetical protein
MKKIHSMLAVLTLAGAALAPVAAQAADVSQAAQTITLTAGTNYFGHSFAGGVGDTFSDRYNFTTSGINNLGSLVSAFSPTMLDDIKISGLWLYNSANMSLGGTQVLDGQVDLWTLATSHLAADSYYLLVKGELLSASPSSYAGTLTVTPVPEPETYGMLLAGLGLVGYLARRRGAIKAA